ncbi:MAG: hypothetical protein HFG59_00060 [Lachnospiraceae bacterium]|nr:hypothetical protein [Lachnospiraceae bacterium]
MKPAVWEKVAGLIGNEHIKLNLAIIRGLSWKLWEIGKVVKSQRYMEMEYEN